MVVPVLFPDPVAGNDHQFLFPGARYLNDVRHARDWLLVERDPFDLLVTEVTN